MPAATDRAVLQHAREHGLWLLTFDRDCGDLVFAHAVLAPPAILFLRQGPQAMAAHAQTLLTLLQDEAAVLGGHMVVINGTQVRRRALPGTEPA